MKFLININEITANGLVASADSELGELVLNPFCRVDFASGYHIMQTEFIDCDADPSWSVSSSFFFESSSGPTSLKDLDVVFEVFDRRPSEDDALIGSARCDLYTIATGPSFHEHHLVYKGDSFSTGRISFILEMTQICIDVQVLLSSCFIKIWSESDASKKEFVALEHDYSNRADVTLQSSCITLNQNLSTGWKVLEPLRLSGSVVDFENGHICISVLSRIGSQELVRRAMCILPLRLYHPATTDLIPFKEKLIDDQSAELGVIQGNICFLNGPDLGQMIGGRCTDDGVEPGEVAWRDAPQPQCVIGEKAKIASRVAPDRFTSIKDSVCWRAPSYPRTLQNACPMRPPRKAGDVDSSPMPRGWSECVDHNSNVYFKFHATKQTSFLDPRHLPLGWEQAISADGHVFFFCHGSHASCWLDPRGFPSHWQMILPVDDSSRPRFLDVSNAPLNTSCSLDPRGLPEGISQHIDATTGRVFFKNHQKKTTSWEDPREKESLEIVEDRVCKELDLWNLQHRRYQAQQQQQRKSFQDEDLIQRRNLFTADIERRLCALLHEEQSWFASTAAELEATIASRCEPEWRLQTGLKAAMGEMRRKQAEETQKAEARWQAEMEQKRKQLVQKHKEDLEHLRSVRLAKLERLVVERRSWQETVVAARREEAAKRLQEHKIKRKALQDEVEAFEKSLVQETTEKEALDTT